ncbi:MAG: PilT/PilU family type 4a pilus ATPase [Verrucomicrobia bacterium]|nr:PilT/PilU family type 4a pilus ATPase [Verrucomicrobiota bacterium]MCF7709400.1 PilT/PilU family type 4a pilus ATPase [Verrucomicrobiota bacterium]
MTKNELNRILESMLDLRADVSDLNFTVDKPPQIESDNELYPASTKPPIEKLTPHQTEMIALTILGTNRRLIEQLLRTGSCDTSYAIPGKARFRVNIFSQRGSFSIVLRKLSTKIPAIEQLGLPPIFHQIAEEKTGLILVTGATGSGKTTTLASILNHINHTKSYHIITLEDPVEFVHEHKKSTFNQRELGSDFNMFATGLRASLRQAPKVIMVGEMRDRETVEIGLTAAETGHLVLSSLHTIDSGQTINRILGMFDQEEQQQVRFRLADTLRWVVSQRLVTKQGGGRTLLLEVMGSNLRTSESIIQGESEGKTFNEIIEASKPFGWTTFDSSCIEAYENGLISEETALFASSKRGIVSRAIDALKKQKGFAADTGSRLQMKSPPQQPQPSQQPPEQPRGFFRKRRS